MSVISKSPPWQLAEHSVREIMLIVMIATLPAVLMHLWFFGYGILLTLGVASLFALLTEAICLYARQQPVRQGLSDNSALLTAMLFALAMPPGSGWWLLLAGMVFAIALVKHAFGGLGHNAFNPAMGGYLFLLLAFPQHMHVWHLPGAALTSSTDHSLLDLESLYLSFQFLLATTHEQFAAISEFSRTVPGIGDLLASQDSAMAGSAGVDTVFASAATSGWELVNLAFLLGGLWLLGLRIISWHIPVAVIAGVVAMCLLCTPTTLPGLSGGFWFVDAAWLHLFGGATMLCAWFIATDPVSACTSNPAKLVYGAIIGCGIYALQTQGSFLNALAIAVLFGNFCAPLLDHTIRPRIFGHRR